MIQRIENVLRSIEHGLGLIFDRVVHLDWRLVVGGLACHVAAQVIRTRAWANIIAAAYPKKEVPWRPVALASLTGTGVNAVLPARAGEPVKLFLVKHKLTFTRYPTLISSLIPETLFETVCGLGLVVWLAASGYLPTSPALNQFPTVDVPGILRHPGRSIVVAVAVAVLLAVSLTWARKRTIEFWERLKQGFSILRQPAAYLTGVVTWQALARVLRLGSFWFMLAAFKLPASFDTALLVMAAQSAGTVLPIPPGGALLRVALLSYAFLQISPADPPDPAVVTAFAVGVPSMFSAVNVVVGLICLLAATGTVDYRDLLRRARRETSRARERRKAKPKRSEAKA